MKISACLAKRFSINYWERLLLLLFNFISFAKMCPWRHQIDII